MPARIEPGTWGRIKVTPAPQKPGLFRATARYGDHDGRTRTVQAFASSPSKAERALTKKLRARPAHTDGSIQASGLFGAAAETWYTYEVERRKLADGSLEAYRRALNFLKDSKTIGLWTTPLHKIETPDVDRILNDIALQSEAKASRLHVVLGKVFSLAVRQGAIKKEENPVPAAKVDLRAREDEEPEVFSLEELARLRAAARDYMSERRRGPRPSVPMDVLIDVMIGGGGLRPGEALALLWEETELDTAVPSIRVTGTIKVVSESAGLGFHGVYRKRRPKTKKSRRRLLLDRRAAEALRSLPREPEGLIFRTRVGTPVSPRNVNRNWHAVRTRAGLPNAKLKMFRATVATLVDEATDTRTASRLLGHSGERITRESYIRTPETAPDVRAILDALP